MEETESTPHNHVMHKLMVGGDGGLGECVHLCGPMCGPVCESVCVCVCVSE